MKMKIKHKAKGGGVDHEYNAVGSPEMSEDKDKSESFKKGGKKHKKGGAVEKEKSKGRPDKKPRRASGGSVFSSASKKTAAAKDEAGQGHEGDGPKGDDPDRSYACGGRASGGKTPNFHPGGEKGKLHRELGIAEDKKIPAKRLSQAANSRNPEIRRDAIRAETMKKWHHAGRSKG